MFELTTSEVDNLNKMIDHWQKEQSYYKTLLAKCEREIEVAADNIDDIRMAISRHVEEARCLESVMTPPLEHYVF